MEATFKIQADEFNLNLFEKLQLWIQNNGNSEITISIKNENISEVITYDDLLKKSVQELAEGKSKTFTMEELKVYLESNFL